MLQKNAIIVVMTRDLLSYCRARIGLAERNPSERNNASGDEGLLNPGSILVVRCISYN